MVDVTQQIYIRAAACTKLHLLDPDSHDAAHRAAALQTVCTG
jgi:hypothetical protein